MESEILDNYEESTSKETEKMSISKENISSPEPSDAHDTSSSSLPSPKISRNYNCTECRFTTTKAKVFLTHRIENHDESLNIFPCRHCEYASQYKHKLQRHEKMAHKPGGLEHKSLKSKSSSKVMKKGKKLPAIPKLKVKLSTNGSAFSKVITTKTKAIKATKKRAALSKAAECIIPLDPPEGVLTFRCKLCLYKGKSRPRMINHVISMHINAKMLKCKFCSFKTTKKIELYLHKKEHMSGKEVYRCPECEYISNYKPNLDRHMENHGKDYAHKCKMCNFSSENSGALARHVSSHHPQGNEFEEMDMDGEEITDQSLEEGLYTCECGSAHKTADDLERHIVLKHPEKTTEEKSGEEMEEEEDEYMTEQEEDEDWQDAELPPGKLSCRYCSYLAKNPSDLRKHLSIHSLEKRFKCPICWKKYKYTGDLNVHIKRDHNQEPATLDIEKVSIVPLKKNSPTLYRCPACPYTTNWKSDMERHSHVHGSEDKTYQCNYCMYQTYWRGDITRHLYRKHEDKISKVDDILKHVIFRNELVVPKGKSRYGNAHNQDSPITAVNIKQEVIEPEVSFQEEPEPDKDWDNKSTSSLTSSKDVSVLGATNNNGIYHCDHCEFTANAPSKMKAHVATHLNFKQFMCPVCGKRANWKWDIQKHMKKDHPSTQSQVVKLSEEEARETIGNYLATMPAVRRSHHLPSPTKAPPATPKFTLKIPTIRPSVPRPQQAEPVATKPSAVNRSPIAAGQKPYQCSLCGLRSNFRWSISKHLRTIHEGVQGTVIVYKMNEVVPDMDSSLEMQTKKTLTPPKVATEDSKKVFMCVACGKKCLLKGDVKKHYKYMHPGQDVLIKYLVTGKEFLYDSSFVEDKYTMSNHHNTSMNSSLDSSMDSSLSASEVNSPMEAQSTKSAPCMGNQTSTHNDPKKHGYVKPFKCSICGHRSNWKWDSKRHLREKHMGSSGYVIVLSIESATSTYAKECLNTPSPEKKPPLPLSSIPSEDLDRLKRLKCSICEYRSNWRTDIMRHSRKKHPNRKPEVILLDANVAKETLESYSYHYQKGLEVPNNNAGYASSSAGTKHGAALKKEQRVWRCPKCAFCGVGNSDIIKHMQKHNMKPFKCCICEFTTNFRGALYRHVRKIHHINDYAKCTKVLIKYSQDENDPADNNGTPETYREAYVDIFLCKICNFQTSFKYLCCRHLREKHGTTDYTNVLKIRKRQKVKVKSVTKDSPAEKNKPYMCSICPYKAFKKGLLHFHMTYHKPQPGNKYKCKFCPYYVCAPRLLHQHMKLHSSIKEDGWYKSQTTPSSSPQKNSPYKSECSDDATQRKHICEKCPYTTNSKNDFIYHKQFHRPKPSAEFKCEFCDYWVTHKRLLKQHMKLHTDAMKLNMYGSLQGSPCKSEMSDASVIFDTVEIASIKQKIISSKITASLSSSPAVSPMKIASKCGVGSRPGYVLKGGSYKKVHRCTKCPYFNFRLRNLELHELMHGYRKSNANLLKCPHCDYHVGARGLLSHHMKVHQPNYCPDQQDNTISELEKQEGLGFDDEDDDHSSDTPEIQTEHKVDTLLEIARFKKFCCEKCPYATAKRFQFQRHCELHGSKQRYTCEFCDYSVPSNNLLLQHRKIHMMPNQNLLAAQSLTNLQHLTEVPADVALASALPPIDTREPVTISVIHDHLDLYENMEDLEPKKLYRCDRCPYANVRRDHLLAHLKFHMIQSELNCPYCDYSVPKQNLLTQHIRVHFCPLPELSDWLVQNGQASRAKEMKDQDISEAVELAHKCQVGKQNGIAKKDGSKGASKAKDATASKEDKDPEDDQSTVASSTEKEIMGPPPPPKSKPAVNGCSNNIYVCQYCDREFAASDSLLRHEMQHLIGNHFENGEDNNKRDDQEPEDTEQQSNSMMETEENKMETDEAVVKTEVTSM